MFHKVPYTELCELILSLITGLHCIFVQQMKVIVRQLISRNAHKKNKKENIHTSNFDGFKHHVVPLMFTYPI